MELNGFDSDDVRYFYLESSCDWSGITNFSYGELKRNNIFKISKKDLVDRLFNKNWYHLILNAYPYEIIEYPTDKPFDIFEYIRMQRPIVFKWDGVFGFSYEKGDYAYFDNWMREKMQSNQKSKRLFGNRDSGSIKEENERILSLICDEEKISFRKPFLIEGKEEEERDLSFVFNDAFKFRVDTDFEIEYKKDEIWYLTNISLFLTVFNQDFIRLFTNSREILGKEKEQIFMEEYQDNIPSTTRRYYKVKEGVTITNLYQVWGNLSLEKFNLNFESLVVSCNVKMVNTCNLNRENFKIDGSIKYFYVDYMDGFSDGIAEKEILKIAIRLPQREALNVHKNNMIAIDEKRKYDEALRYIQSHKSSYKKFCHRNPSSNPTDFIEKEKKQLIRRLIKTMKDKSSI